MNYFTLELDTTPPSLQILTPNNAPSNNTTIVRIEANEELADWQNIYAIDGLGNRQDLSFNYHLTYFEGEVTFNFENEVITIFAQLKDTVDNISDIVSKPIRILNGQPLTLILNSKSRTLECAELTTNINVSTSDRKISTDTSRNCKC